MGDSSGTENGDVLAEVGVLEQYDDKDFWKGFQRIERPSGDHRIRTVVYDDQGEGKKHYNQEGDLDVPAPIMCQLVEDARSQGLFASEAVFEE